MYGGWLDIALMIIFATSTLSGLWKGFARIGIGTAATFFGILLAIGFYAPVGSLFEPYVSSRGLANFLGFMLRLGACSLAGSLLARFVAYLFRQVGLGWLDRLLGGGVGFLRGLIVAIALVMALVAFAPNPPSKSVVESRYAPFVLDAAKVLIAIAPKELSDGFVNSYGKIKEHWQSALAKGSALLPPKAEQQ